MSITLDVSAGLLNEPDEVLLGLVEAGHVGSWKGHCFSAFQVSVAAHFLIINFRLMLIMHFSTKVCFAFVTFDGIGGGGGGGRSSLLPFVILLDAVIGPSSSLAFAASSSELIFCLLDANGFFPPNKSFPSNFETPPDSKAFFFL